MKRDELYISHIVQAANDIESYVGKLDFEDFRKNKLLQDGVMRKLEIIGEAAKRLSPAFRNSSSKIPWNVLPPGSDHLTHQRPRLFFAIKTILVDFGII